MKLSTIMHRFEFESVLRRLLPGGLRRQARESVARFVQMLDGILP
ncbi:hypothetical protein [Nitrosococcus oceani]|nr:hypothetical protein [Nitrosococcus oceani]